MNFFKRYYDKVILFVLLVLFVGLMVYVWSIIEHSDSRKDLKLPPLTVDTDLGKKTDADYQYKKLWTENKLTWKGNGESDTTSDLVVAEKLAECPYCSQRVAGEGGSNKVLIPVSAFGKNCPNLHADGKSELPAPLKPEEFALADSAGGFDSDGDGISDVDEDKYGLKKHDKSDGRADNDGDGFSNRYEISKGFDPTDYKSCPPLWHRLKVVKIDTVELPVKLLSVDTNKRKGKDSPKDEWVALCKEPKFNRRKKLWEPRDKEVYINGTILVDNDLSAKYRVMDIIKEINQEKKTEQFRVELREVLAAGQKNITPRTLTMISGETVKSSDSRPVIRDTGRPNDENIVRRVGARFELYRHSDTKIDNYVEQYEVKSFDDGKVVSVTLTKVGSDEEFVITHDGEVPKNDEVVASSN